MEPNETPEITSPTAEAEAAPSRAYEELLRHVIQGGVEPAFAEQAALGVLCSLERRLFGLAPSHLEARLPFRMKALLAWCTEHRAKLPQAFGKDTFIKMVSAHLGVPQFEAERLSRAVLAAVKAQISPEDADDVAAQLPPDLAELWRAPH